MVRKATRPIITTHINPDGDAIGAEVALAELLRSINVKPRVINVSPVPDIYRFLCRRGEPLVYDPELHEKHFHAADLAIVLDANSWGRAGAVGERLSALHVPSICIDHHERQGPFATACICVPGASSTCELVYEFAAHLGVPLSRRGREAIYTGILFDTGNFRHSNTTPRVHEIAAHLIASGIIPERMYERVFESFTWERMRLFAKALQNLKSECDGKIACLLLTREMFNSTGARPEDVEGLVDWLRSIGQARLIIILREFEKGKTKVSFRSKDDSINVEQLARAFGGGGHKRAAGADLELSINIAYQRIIQAASEVVR